MPVERYFQSQYSSKNSYLLLFTALLFSPLFSACNKNASLEARTTAGTNQNIPEEEGHLVVYNLQGGNLKKSIYVGTNLTNSTMLYSNSNYLQLNCPNFKNEGTGIIVRSSYEGENRFAIADELIAE
jgi:hypothetical protein